MELAAARRDIDDSPAIRAAWLHYAAGLTQAEVAERLGVSGVTAHRLVAAANRSGAVRISVDAVETALSDHTVGPEQVGLKTTRITAIAGGAEKVAAIRAVLSGGCPNGLITDKRTALALVADAAA